VTEFPANSQLRRFLR